MLCENQSWDVVNWKLFSSVSCGDDLESGGLAAVVMVLALDMPKMAVD